MVSWLVSTDHLDRNINIVFSVKARLFFFLKDENAGKKQKVLKGQKENGSKN